MQLCCILQRNVHISILPSHLKYTAVSHTCGAWAASKFPTTIAIKKSKIIAFLAIFFQQGSLFCLVCWWVTMEVHHVMTTRHWLDSLQVQCDFLCPLQHLSWWPFSHMTDVVLVPINNFVLSFLTGYCFTWIRLCHLCLIVLPRAAEMDRATLVAFNQVFESSIVSMDFSQHGFIPSCWKPYSLS